MSHKLFKIHYAVPATANDGRQVLNWVCKESNLKFMIDRIQNRYTVLFYEEI